MRRTIAGLTTALLVSYAVLNPGDIEGGHRRRACCNAPATCCAPRATCCTPQASTCCPSNGCCNPCKSGEWFCVSSLRPVFTYPGGAFYNGIDYTSNAPCGMMNPGNPETLPISDLETPSSTQSCAPGSTPDQCCSPAPGTFVDYSKRSSGLKSPLEYDDTARFEDEERTFMLPPGWHIVRHTFVKLCYQQSPTDAIQFIPVRLMILADETTPRIPKFYGVGLEIRRFPAGVEANAQCASYSGSGYTRIVHFGLDYRVVLHHLIPAN